MLSEGKNIDQVFREKAEAFNPGRALLDADWTGISGQLPVKEKRRKPAVIWLRSAAAVAAIVVLFFTIKSVVNNKETKIEPAEQPVARQTMPVLTPPATDTARLPDTPAFRFAPVTIDFNSWHHNWFPPQTNNNFVTLPSNNNVVFPIVQDNNIAVLSGFDSELAVASESFTISNNRDNTLNFKKGTSVFIPANTFYSGGSLINGEVTFSVTEYYTLAEMAAAKLNTTSGGQMLKSGGMLFIKAVYNNQEVDAALKNALTVSMPATKEFDPEMQLFLPVNNTDRFVGRINLSNNTMEFSGPASANTFQWASAGQIQKISSNIARNNVYRDYTVTPGELPRILVPTLDVVKPYKYNKNTAIFLTDHLDVDVKDALTVALEKKYPGYKIKLRSGFVGAKRFITQDNEQFPQFISSVTDSTWMPFTYGYKNGYATAKDSLRYTNWLLNIRIRDSVWNAQMDQQRQYQQGIKALENKYKFSISQLGWINCDRFVNENVEKTEFLVNVGGNARAYVVQAIFPRINSIITSYGIESKTNNAAFINMPLGEQVYIIAIGVRNGKVVAAYKETVITKETLTGLVFEETDAGAFKQKLQQIN